MRTNPSALATATAIGTVLQLVMVISGHFVPAIAMMFGILGMLISAVAGVLYARRVAATRSAAAGGGAIAGGVCALIGIAVSFALGDVTAAILVLGTLSSAVTGALGGLLGRSLGGRVPGCELPPAPRLRSASRIWKATLLPGDRDREGRKLPDSEFLPAAAPLF